MNRSYRLLRTALAGALLATAATAGAAVLTPEEALLRATAQGNTVTPLAAGHDSYQLSYTIADGTTADEAAIYVFSSNRPGGGFLVVSADDSAEPLLGYADGGQSFDPASMPPAMKWWLDEYTRQIAAARDIPALRAIERPQRDPIAPMLTTTWNQDAPYNGRCPIINGQRSVTGCVATAMAQLVNYHRWPETGTGSHSYYYNNSWISLDFSTITFDWANMLPDYSGGRGTERQKAAVGQLMYACGVSVDMQYSPIESGAADVLVAEALVSYFNYDRNVRYAERDYFGLLDWEEFIYNQLRDYGPVQYSGSGSLGGHSFVCDGYSEDGYFHFNWGWGGISDGYFLLTALNPPMQGIGGATSGYNYDQAVIANVRKPRANSQMYLNLMMDMGFNVVPVKTTTATRPGDQVKVDSRVINYSTGTASGSIGIKFTNRETGEVKYSTAPSRFSLPTLTPMGGYTAQIPSTLRTGTYDLTPSMCGTDGVWVDVPVKLSTVQSVTMTIKNGTCTFAPATGGSVEVSDVTLHTPVYLGNLFHLTATAVNTGDTEFVGKLVPTLASGHTPIAKTDPISVDILPGDSYEIDFTGVFNHFSAQALPPAGTYTLYIVKEATNEIVSAGMEVELHAVPENTTISVDKFEFDGDPNHADRSNLAFNGTISCSAGYFGNSLAVVIFPYTSGQVTSVGYFATPDFFLGAGQSADFTAGGTFGAGETGKKYFAAIFDGQTNLTDMSRIVIFTLTQTAGIDDVTADDPDSAIVSTRIYTTDGRLATESAGSIDLETAPLAPGIYIVETMTASGTRTAVRILKR